MGWKEIRPFFNEIMEGKGFQPWSDGFNFENIPSNLLDKSFHLTFASFTGAGANQWDQESRVGVEVRFFLKGFNDPAEAIDRAIEHAQDIVIEVVRPSKRNETECIQNVVFSDMVIEPLADTNDNALVVQINFEVRVVLETLT